MVVWVSAGSIFNAELPQRRPNVAVGRRLRALRTENKVSMNKVHLETRMSTSYLAKLEQDKFVPGTENLVRIVNALKVLDVQDADVLFSEHEAVQRERQALATVQDRLAHIDDLDERLRLLDELVGQIPSVS
jgi:transcriptional regulator with XRE-family HTH domain